MSAPPDDVDRNLPFKPNDLAYRLKRVLWQPPIEERSVMPCRVTVQKPDLVEAAGEAAETGVDFRTACA